MVYKKRLVSSFNKLSGKSKEGARKFYIRNELFFFVNDVFRGSKYRLFFFANVFYIFRFCKNG